MQGTRSRWLSTYAEEARAGLAKTERRAERRRRIAAFYCRHRWLLKAALFIGAAALSGVVAGLLMIFGLIR